LFVDSPNLIAESGNVQTILENEFDEEENSIIALINSEGGRRT
jgi:hypothetical protein